ncbi:hypothetical protein [Pseudomonas sp. C2B4]|uniref:hypothetical protein n=1 Tax=Pseudomonas sp. C2B4 TaxID=2735270 RepID=UPI001C49B12D|nr:hypothetical protein [Pseudomonas sp. C2B4]
MSKFTVHFNLTAQKVGVDSNEYEIISDPHSRIDAPLESFISMTVTPKIGHENTFPLGENVSLTIVIQLIRKGTNLRSGGNLVERLIDFLEDLIDFNKTESKIAMQIINQMYQFGNVTLQGTVLSPDAPENTDHVTDGGKVDTSPTVNDSNDSDLNSAPLPPDSYKVQNPITLQRTTRPLTGDVALWLMIKMNANNLNWDNYTAQLDLLFGSDPTVGHGLLEGAQRLSRRRFLPFTDTDAYRALKVATEAFVVTWGGVVPDKQNISSVFDLIQKDTTAINIASERLGIDISQGELVKIMTDQYFGTSFPPTIPYLTRVVEGLRGTDAERSANAAKEHVEKTQISQDPPYCGETCLWLAHLNQDFSAKLARPPLTELIWSYWMEEMQLVQTMNAISRRFQNVSSGPRDPLAQFELDAVRPLSNMIWGWVQDEQHRLPIERRAAEYQHEYGFRLFGRAVPTTHAADVRSKFLAAFHTLLNQCVPFFRQADDTTVVPDGFPLLNALREVHLILSEGAHNQFRDLPSTSRIEMMMQQWILARQEMREFLPRRAMIAYPEPWMHSVESMRKLQGWGDTNTYQFWQLATTGEQIVSSIRWGNWNSINDPTNAANWAVFFRPEIQTYIHSYRAVTGIDVSAEPVDVQVPGIHLMRRLHEQQVIKVERRSTAP